MNYDCVLLTEKFYIKHIAKCKKRRTENKVQSEIAPALLVNWYHQNHYSSKATMSRAPTKSEQ
jgi:hypothetical protein